MKAMMNSHQWEIHSCYVKCPVNTFYFHFLKPDIIASNIWSDTAIKTTVSNNCHWANFGNPIREKMAGEGAVATQREITYFDVCRSLRDPKHKIIYPL